MSEDLVMFSGRVPAELKQLVDADPRDNQEVLKAALWREMGGERMASLERRIEEKKDRINMIEREKNERERELAQERDELEALELKLDKEESKESELMQDVKEKLENVPLEPENPGVQAQADRVDMEPTELIKEVKEDAE
jgi:chromosome segregation ATPase